MHVSANIIKNTHLQTQIFTYDQQGNDYGYYLEANPTAIRLRPYSANQAHTLPRRISHGIGWPLLRCEIDLCRG